ncbi:hypothetical protein BDN67DRAFT_982861 [Paxillus ammoniavirescens]|nr:hypothetical protein BDN67DRAFT_982861 [Paxillus ammoniavirescens]
MMGGPLLGHVGWARNKAMATCAQQWCTHHPAVMMAGPLLGHVGWPRNEAMATCPSSGPAIILQRTAGFGGEAPNESIDSSTKVTGDAWERGDDELTRRLIRISRVFRVFHLPGKKPCGHPFLVNRLSKTQSFQLLLLTHAVSPDNPNALTTYSHHHHFNRPRKDGPKTTDPQAHEDVKWPVWTPEKPPTGPKAHEDAKWPQKGPVPSRRPTSMPNGPHWRHVDPTSTPHGPPLP